VTVPNEFNHKEAKASEALKFACVPLESELELRAEAGKDPRGTHEWAGGSVKLTEAYLNDCTQDNGVAPSDKAIKDMLVAASKLTPDEAGLRLLVERGSVSISLPGKSGGNFSFSLRTGDDGKRFLVALKWS